MDGGFIVFVRVRLRLCFLVPGQSVHLGMGGSGSGAVPRHLRTVRHILPGLLYLLLRGRVSSSTHLNQLH